MPVITIAGSLGGSARDIAQAVARDMHIEYVDREIMAEAARELGVSVSAVASRDERPSSIGERLAGVLRTLMERSAAAGAADPMAGGGLELVLARTYGEAAELPEAGQGQLDDERYLKTLTSVIRGIAARGNVVILGRGSQAILHDAPETLHVYVYEPKDARIALMVERDGMRHHDAEHQINKRDQERQAFYRRYFKVDVGHPDLYDVVVHAGRMPQQAIVELVCAAAHAKMPRPG